MMLRLGSRGSPLALAQIAPGGRRCWRRTAAHDAEAFPIETFMTSGDRIQGRLQDQGGKGLFTKELDEALLDGRIDCAIHSMKDLPTRMPPGIVLAAVPAREDQRDAFIATRAKTLTELPAGATVGTASLRRQAQTLHLRPDLKVELLRGRVETRLAKIESGAFDATYLALAGLRAWGWRSMPPRSWTREAMPPAPGQGALAITARAGDEKTLALAGAAQHRRTRHHHHGGARLPGGAGRLLPHAHRGPGADRGRPTDLAGRSADAGRQASLAARGQRGAGRRRLQRLPARWACNWARKSAPRPAPLYTAHFGDKGW